MRKLVLLFVPFLLCCGGGDGGSDAGADAANDVTQNDAPVDATKDASSDTGSDVVVASDAGDGGLACTSPAGCGGSTTLCCGTVVLNGGSPPNCTASSVTSQCSAQCASAFVSNCSGTETVQLCAQGPDCKDPTYDKCCTFTSGNQSLTFCATDSMATFAGATCH